MPSKRVVIAVILSMVIVMTAGCAGWGTDGPAEPQSEEDGNDDEETHAQDETPDDEDSSAASSNSSESGESSTDEGSDGEEMSSTASEAESASDADSGSESTANVDSDSKSETNANPDSESESTTEANQDSDSESNVNAEGGSADVDINIDDSSSTTVESESNSDSDSTSVADSDSDSTSVSSSESASDSEASSDSVSSAGGSEDESTNESGSTEDGASSQSSTNDADDGSDESDSNNSGSNDPSSGDSEDDSDGTEDNSDTHTVIVHAGEPEPVENVDVTIKRHTDGETKSATTGEDGTVEFDVYEGEHTVTGVDERREEQSVRVEVTEDTEVTLNRMERPLGDMKGSSNVIIDQNGDPVEGVALRATTDIPGGETHVMETDATSERGWAYGEGYEGETYTLQEVYDAETGETYPVLGVTVDGQKDPKEFVHTSGATATIEIEHPGSFPEGSNETAAA